MFIKHNSATDGSDYLVVPVTDIGYKYTGELMLINVGDSRNEIQNKLDAILDERGDKPVVDNRMQPGYKSAWLPSAFIVEPEEKRVRTDMEWLLNYKHRRPGGQLGRGDSRAAYTIAGPNAKKGLLDVKMFANALEAVAKVDPQILAYKVMGTPAYAGKTVVSIIAGKTLEDPVNRALRNESLTMYHGTSLMRWTGHMAATSASMETLEAIKWDPNGIGTVPFQAGENVAYFGFYRKMLPSEFMALCPPGVTNERTPDYIAQQSAAGKTVANPYLSCDWDAKGKFWRTIDHEGRGRSTAAGREAPGKKIPVVIFPRGGLRARHLTPEMLAAPIKPQRS